MLMTMSISSRAVGDRPARFVGLHVGGRGAQRKRHDRTDADAAAVQRVGGQRDPDGVDADVGEPELERLAAQGLDVLPCRFGPEERVVDQSRDSPAVILTSGLPAPLEIADFREAPDVVRVAHGRRQPRGHDGFGLVGG